MNKILLIWDGDSSLKVYLLYVDYGKFEKIKKCHERYINVNENDELIWLNNWLIERETDLIFESGQVEKFNFPIILESTLVVCGFAE